MARVAQVDRTEPRKRHAVTAVPGRHHAIEHVDAARDRLQDVLGRADTHQIARPVRRQERRHLLDHRQHHRLRLADRKAADGVAVKAGIDHAARAGVAQLGHIAALRDAEQHVPEGALSNARLLRSRPAQRELHRALDVAALRPAAARIRRAAWRCRSRAAAAPRSTAPATAHAWRRRYASGRSPRCSLTLRNCASDITWKPPESVSIGPFQPVNFCRPPSAAIRSAPGRSIR